MKKLNKALFKVLYFTILVLLVTVYKFKQILLNNYIIFNIGKFFLVLFFIIVIVQFLNNKKKC